MLTVLLTVVRGGFRASTQRFGISGPVADQLQFGLFRPQGELGSIPHFSREFWPHGKSGRSNEQFVKDMRRAQCGTVHPGSLRNHGGSGRDHHRQSGNTQTLFKPSRISVRSCGDTGILRKACPNELPTRPRATWRWVVEEWLRRHPWILVRTNQHRPVSTISTDFHSHH